MILEALVLFSVVAGNAPLVMVDVGPEEVFCQKTTGGNDENAKGAKEEVEARSRREDRRGRGIGMSGFPKDKPEQNAKGGPSNDDGAGRTGGKLEKGFRKEGKAGSDEPQAETETPEVALLGAGKGGQETPPKNKTPDAEKTDEADDAVFVEGLDKVVVGVTNEASARGLIGELGALVKMELVVVSALAE